MEENPPPGERKAQTNPKGDRRTIAYKDDLPCRLESSLNGGRRAIGPSDGRDDSTSVTDAVGRGRFIYYTGRLEDEKSFGRRLGRVLEAAGNIFMM